MSSFKGSYEYSVDSKGRINIPSKLRRYVSSEANDTFVITRGFDRCLFAYPLDEWNSLEQSVRKLSPFDSKHRFFERTLLRWAAESQLDAQSRITIPRELLQLAGIENAVLIIGVLERIEIWNPQLYQEYLTSQGETYEEVAQRVFTK
jgi:MraZ protein